MSRPQPATSVSGALPALLRSPFRGGWFRLSVLLTVPLLAGIAVLGADDLSDPVGQIALVVIGIALAIQVPTALHGVRALPAAEKRVQQALDRLATAEAAERSRADLLAGVLEANQGLVLTGDSRVDCGAVLAAITLPGATTFLVRSTADRTEVVAAHGPLAAGLIGMRMRPSRREARIWEAPIASYSLSGRTVGERMTAEHVHKIDASIQAALAVRLVDHTGQIIGWLHLVDTEGEQILEPSFVSLTQLVGNGIAVAMESNALLARLRQQLGEVQRVQQQLVRASRLGAIGELAAAVAHEVNNPLTGILGFSEMLVAELPVDDPRRTDAEVIRDEALRARSIIRTLLEFARPRPPVRVRTELNEIAHSALDLLRYRAQDANVTITETYGDLPVVELDPDGLRQVVLNLCNNSIEAMPAGGELRISTVRMPERVGVVISDTGIGMDRETLGRVFSPFFSTKAGSGGGTGLGLSVSLQIVEGHGGTIEVQSEPGRGTVFTVWLPTASRIGLDDLVGAALAGSEVAA